MAYFFDEATVQVLRTGKGGGGCHWMRTVWQGCWHGCLSKAEDGFSICLDSLVRLTTWLGLGTTFSSRWSLELACLSWRGSKTGHSAWTAHHLGTCIQPECARNPWSDTATNFALQTREVTSCALSSNATLQRTAEWAVQLWVVFLLGHTKAYILWWAGLWIRFLAQREK